MFGGHAIQYSTYLLTISSSMCNLLFLFSALPSFYSLSAAFLPDSPQPYQALASSGTSSGCRKKAQDQGKVSDGIHGYGLWLQVTGGLVLPPLRTLFHSVCFSQSANQATQGKGENFQDVRMPTGERLRQEESILCGLQFQLFRGCSAQANRELKSEKNGIFPVAVQTCFNHRNEHKMRLVPSAIVWFPFPPAGSQAKV